jgi:hypothetical protein
LRRDRLFRTSEAEERKRLLGEGETSGACEEKNPLHHSKLYRSLRQRLLDEANPNAVPSSEQRQTRKMAAKTI